MAKETWENQITGEEELVEIRKYFEDIMEYEGFEGFSDADEEEKEELWDSRKKQFLTQIDVCERKRIYEENERKMGRWEDGKKHIHT